MESLTLAGGWSCSTTDGCRACLPLWASAASLEELLTDSSRSTRLVECREEMARWFELMGMSRGEESLVSLKCGEGERRVELLESLVLGGVGGDQSSGLLQGTASTSCHAKCLSMRSKAIQARRWCMPIKQHSMLQLNTVRNTCPRLPVQSTKHGHSAGLASCWE
jgi:hypothetical protein